MPAHRARPERAIRPPVEPRGAWRSILLAGVVAALIALPGAAALAGVGHAAPGRPLDGPGVATGSPPGVIDLTYSLGDDAMSVSGFESTNPLTGNPTRRAAPLELTGEVYAPAALGGARHPLIVLAHGYWETCADRGAARARTRPGRFKAAEAKLLRWPCAAGTPELPSYRGFAYLGDALARQGFIVVSIGLNGVNAGELSGDDRARAAVIDRHLAMWATLERTGGGPLAGHFVDAASGTPVQPAFTGAVDLAHVGLLGHSRGGRGVMYAGAASHAGRLPAGVHVRAVFGLAAAGEGSDSAASRREYRPEHAAVMTWTGTCDGATGTEAREYNAGARTGATTANLTMSVAGADHDFLNEQWSPSSHQVVAYDDAAHPHGDRRRCLATSTSGGRALPSGHRPSIPELTETQERSVAATYVSAFFQRYLLGRREFDGILAGHRRPDAAITTVWIKRYATRGG